MRVLFLCEGETIPASRFRVGQFIPHFEHSGISCKVRFGYGADYEQKSKSFGAAYKLAWRARRFAFAADADEFDVVFIQRPTFPHTALPEQLVNWLNPHTIFDFDDSVWFGPSGNESTSRRQSFQKTVDMCAHLIAGNEFLAREAGHPEKTTVIPTVIDAKRYVPAKNTNDGVIIGWMGTAGNFLFLEKIVPALETTLARHPKIRFRIVSNSEFKPLSKHPQVEQIRWRPDTEIPLLQSFDIGLMPLVDSPLTHGKCAFKMIQYMAVGRPVVVSQVGANIEVFGDGAHPPGKILTSFDWGDALTELIEDSTSRQIMGENGRARVEEHYCIEAVLPKYLRIFEELMGR